MMFRKALPVLTMALVVLAGCAASPPASAPTSTHSGHGDGDVNAAVEAQLQQARKATTEFTDIGAAEAAGYASTIDTLGCFHDEDRGGMGLHYVSGDLMDAELDETAPEALVFELDPAGVPADLVAHEYIVPVEAWTADDPPVLFGQELQQHPTLPLWVLHAWIYRDNPSGVFAGFNPDVAQCPQGVPLFGVDLP